MSSGDDVDIANSTKASTLTFVAALTLNAATFAVQIVAFTVLLGVYKRVYQQRALKKQVPLLGMLWPLRVFKADYKAIIGVNGLDAYFFVRFLRLMAKIFFPMWIISWAVLLPLTAVNSQVGNNKGLDRLVFGNVEDTKKERYAGHIILLWLFTGWTLWNLKKDMGHFIITRQQHLIDSVHAKTVQANTIMVTGIPAKYLTRTALTKMYGNLPGGVKKIWINRDLKELPEIYDRRLKACNKLEAAEAKFSKAVAKAKAKSDKAATKNKEGQPESLATILESVARPTHKLGFLGLFGEKVDSIEWALEEIRVCTEMLDKGRAEVDAADAADLKEQQINAPSSHITPDERDASAPVSEHEHDPVDGARPSTSSQRSRRGFQQAGQLAKERALKVGDQFTDAAGKVNHVAQQTAQRTTKAAQLAISRVTGKGEEAYPPLNSAFITFNKQIAAHLAVQALAHHEPYRMNDRFIEVNPNDIVWSNLKLNSYEKKVRYAISWALTVGLILVWSVPVAFVGTLSQISAVCDLAPFLGWICEIPDPVPGIIEGILPPVLLAVLTLLLPIILRLFAKFEGIPQDTGLELSLMSRFFLFQVIHGFLIITIAAGITNSISDIRNLASSPASIATTLAEKLPGSSTFFLTFVLLQLAATAGGFLQIVYLVVYYVKQVLLGSTPRSSWMLKYGKRTVSSWGTIWPKVTLICVMAFAYSIISPVINGIAFFFFIAMFQLHKYQFLWVNDQSDTTDTGGMFFPKAIQHVFVGLYIQQLCLAALFFLRQAVPQGALAVVLIIFTIFFHLVFNESFRPLMNALPLSLADKMYTRPEDPPSPITESDSEAQPVDDKRPHRREEEDTGSFAHPAIRHNQRTVWIANDSFGIGAEHARGVQEAGVDVALGEGAEIDEKGKLKVAETPGRPGYLAE